MKLTVLGSGNAIIRKERRAPSFLLDGGTQKVLLDCGWGAPEALLEIGVDPGDIDHIFISHPHADHLGSLISILHSMYVKGVYFPEHAREKALFLHGYPGFFHDYEDLRRIMFPEREEPYYIELFEYDNSHRELEQLIISSARLPHNERYFASVGYRIFLAGKTVVYSGDCGYSEVLVYLCRGADLALIEASIDPISYREGPRVNHLSAHEAGLIAAQAEVKKLVLFHLYDRSTNDELAEEVRKEFKGELIIPNDGQEIDV